MKAIEIIESKTDDELKQLVRDYFMLHSTCITPENFRHFVLAVCKSYGVEYNTRLAESLLVDEVFKRFTK